MTFLASLPRSVSLIVVDAIDDRIVRPQQRAIELQIVGGISKYEIHRPGRDLTEALQAIALQNLADRQLNRLATTLAHTTLLSTDTVGHTKPKHIRPTAAPTAQPSLPAW